ncbi:hypothetical protein [Frankia sp. Ea1.12]|uniref:hypothetical protein n=1 Tax=Parafrankia sp. BMG5.11 TaxID=222540 RepID=UPI000DA44C76|nr:hypothetical protein FRAHR75_150045 [Frankia sp. Hr75.2]SQD94036.1 conserved hypothetical protein [Parafrankia sp. Ea1.12]
MRLDETATRWVTEAARSGALHLVANEFDTGDAAEYADNPDSSEFEGRLDVCGRERHGYRILQLTSNSVPNAIAALLLHLRDLTGTRPNVYFEWSEGNPLQNLARFVFFGAGEVASTTREILREAEPDPQRRLFVHVA